MARISRIFGKSAQGIMNGVGARLMCWGYTQGLLALHRANPRLGPEGPCRLCMETGRMPVLRTQPNGGAVISPSFTIPPGAGRLAFGWRRETVVIKNGTNVFGRSVWERVAREQRQDLRR